MLLVLLIILVIVWIALRRPRFWTVLRGAPAVVTARQANAMMQARGKKLSLPLGPLEVPLDTMTKPTIFFGLPGSGKTTLINMMVPALLSLFEQYCGRTRIVLFDIKNECPAKLHSLSPSHVPIYLLNPLEGRAPVLDFPTLFAARSDIEQLAHAICPPLAGDQTPFFRNAARQTISLVGHVLQKHHHRATMQWGLRVLCSILADKKMLRRVMDCDFEAKSFYAATLGPRIKSAGDVFSTIRSVIQPLVSASLVEINNPHRFHLKSFLRSDGIAILGMPPTGTQAVLPLYNVFLRRLIEEAQLNTHPEDRLIIILDEIAMLDRGIVDAIVKAACIGRSHGLHLLAASQSLELMESEFGHDKAHAFLASCATTVGLRCGSLKTAEYVTGRMGKQEGIVNLTSWTNGQQSSTTVSQQLQMRPTVLAEELLHLPLANPNTDKLTFYAVSPAFGNVKVTSSFIKQTTVACDPHFLNVVPRHSQDHELRPLTEAQWKALGLP